MNNPRCLQEIANYGPKACECGERCGRRRKTNDDLVCLVSVWQMRQPAGVVVSARLGLLPDPLSVSFRLPSIPHLHSLIPCIYIFYIPSSKACSNNKQRCQILSMSFRSRSVSLLSHRALVGLMWDSLSRISKETGRNWVLDHSVTFTRVCRVTFPSCASFTLVHRILPRH